MAEHAAYTNASYECSHCKLVSIGSPAETVVVDNKELTMCCLGCLYAAEMLLCLNDADGHVKTT